MKGACPLPCHNRRQRLVSLGIYVGSLTRYYAGDWETADPSQSQDPVGRYDIVHRGVAGPSADDWTRIRESVLAWRELLNRELSRPTRGPVSLANLQGYDALFSAERTRLLKRPLDWDESDKAAWFVERPDWESYVGVLLLAAYAEHPQLRPPTRIPSNWAEDPAWHSSTADNCRGSRYQQIFRPELWLPGDFAVTFDAEDPAGDRIVIGSSIALLEQLRDVERRAFDSQSSGARNLQELAEDAPSNFKSVARGGFRVFLRLAEISVSDHLPMKLHY